MTAVTPSTSGCVSETPIDSRYLLSFPLTETVQQKDFQAAPHQSNIAPSRTYSPGTYSHYLLILQSRMGKKTQIILPEISGSQVGGQTLYLPIKQQIPLFNTFHSHTKRNNLIGKVLQSCSQDARHHSCTIQIPSYFKRVLLPQIMCYLLVGCWRRCLPRIPLDGSGNWKTSKTHREDGWSAYGLCCKSR